jgi:Holliday junction resolvase RusA-like endonuclease
MGEGDGGGAEVLESVLQARAREGCKGMTSLTITIPLPPKEVRNNWRGHWAKKAAAVKTCRTETRLIAVRAIASSEMSDGLPWKKASVKVTAYFPTARHLDPTNLIDALKPAFDGLQDAGVIENDKELWPERPVIVTKDANPRVELVITEEGNE